MGGPWQLRFVPVADVPVQTVVQAAYDALRLVDDQMSTYRPDSDLMRLNAAPTDSWVTVPPDLMSVVAEGLRIGELSGQRFNIGIGDTVNDWGFGPLPTPVQLPTAKAYGRVPILLHPTRPAISKTSAVTLDLCGLAKGFAVDQAARAVSALGVGNFMIEAAGEIYAQGRRGDGSAWQIGFELPVPGKRILDGGAIVDRMAIATSGNYRNIRHIENMDWGHTIDPTKGTPVAGPLLSVTVAHHRCMTADALATALLVMGAEAAPAFANLHGLKSRMMIKVENGILEVCSDAFIGWQRSACP